MLRAIESENVLTFAHVCGEPRLFYSPSSSRRRGVSRARGLKHLVPRPRNTGISLKMFPFSSLSEPWGNRLNACSESSGIVLYASQPENPEIVIMHLACTILEPFDVLPKKLLEAISLEESP